jgi:hypothetical protein
MEQSVLAYGTLLVTGKFPHHLFMRDGRTQENGYFLCMAGYNTMPFHAAGFLNADRLK